MYKGKDNLQTYLESVCHVQAWAKRQIAKKVETVEQINPLSISSIKQKLMKSKQSPLTRINRIIRFYHERGQNRERVNKVYRNVIMKKL